MAGFVLAGVLGAEVRSITKEDDQMQMEIRLMFSAQGDRAKKVVMASEFWGARVVSLNVRDDTVDLRLEVPGAPELLLGFLDAVAFRVNLSEIMGITQILAALRRIPQSERTGFRNPYAELLERTRVPLKGDRFVRRGRLIVATSDALGRHDVPIVDAISGEEGLANLWELEDGAIKVPEIRSEVPDPRSE